MAAILEFMKWYTTLSEVREHFPSHWKDENIEEWMWEHEGDFLSDMSDRLEEFILENVGEDDEPWGEEEEEE